MLARQYHIFTWTWLGFRHFPLSEKHLNLGGLSQEEMAFRRDVRVYRQPHQTNVCTLSLTTVTTCMSPTCWLAPPASPCPSAALQSVDGTYHLMQR